MAKMLKKKVTNVSMFRRNFGKTMLMVEVAAERQRKAFNVVVTTCDHKQNTEDALGFEGMHIRTCEHTAHPHAGTIYPQCKPHFCPYGK